MTDLYGTLGVAKDATHAEIRAAYRKRVRKTHPDTPGGSREAFGALTRAVDVLSDEERRRRYDATGEAPDGPAVDNLEGDALNWATRMVGDAVNAILGRGADPSQQDVLAEARRALRANLDRNIAEQRDFSKRAERYREIAKRFRNKGKGENRLRLLMEGQATMLQRGAEKDEELARPLRRALEILADYEFDVDRPVSPRSPNAAHFVTRGAMSYYSGTT